MIEGLTYSAMPESEFSCTVPFYELSSVTAHSALIEPPGLLKKEEMNDE